VLNGTPALFGPAIVAALLLIGVHHRRQPTQASAQ